MTDQTNKDLPEFSLDRHDLFDLSIELLGVIEDVKNGMPFDDVCMETIISVRERLVCLDALSASAPATAPIEALSSECNECGGTGLRDLGGFYPWGEPTMIECDCISKMPTPNAPAAGSVPSDHDIEMLATGFAIQHRNGLLKFARALLAQYGSPAWQPIETAPKDGTQIMLTNGVDVAQGWWLHEDAYVREQRDLAGVYVDQQEHDGFDGWMDCDGGMQPDPTHWMPLPPAPQEGK